MDLKPVGALAAFGAFSGIEKHLGAGNKVNAQKLLRNVGPSITYRLRDSAGQAKEFMNYQFAVDLGDGVPVFLMGVRENAQDSFKYMRAPADEQGTIQGFSLLRGALLNDAMVEAAIASYATQAVPANRPELVPQLAASARKALQLFTGPEFDGSTKAGTATADISAYAGGGRAQKQRAQTA